MNIEQVSYMVQPTAADSVRLSKLVAKTGKDEGAAIASLVHSFFARRGVKNPSRRANSTSGRLSVRQV